MAKSPESSAAAPSTSTEQPTPVWDVVQRGAQSDWNNKWLSAGKLATAATVGCLLGEFTPAAGLAGSVGKLALAGVGTSFAFDIAPHLGQVNRDNIGQFAFDSVMLSGASAVGHDGYRMFAQSKAASAAAEVSRIYNPTRFLGQEPWLADSSREYQDVLSIGPRSKQIYWMQKGLGTTVHPALTPLYEGLATASKQSLPEFSAKMASHAGDIAAKSESASRFYSATPLVDSLKLLSPTDRKMMATMNPKYRFV